MTSRVGTRAFIAVTIATFAVFGVGCGGGDDNPTLTGQFAASSTPQAVHLVKLVPQSANGSTVVVQAVIYGPDTNLDLYAFAFDVVIGNPSVLAYVTASDPVPGNALQATGGQTIEALAGPDGSDPTHIVVGVSKLGGGSGNGIANASAVIVSLTFQVLGQGSSTLSIASSPTPVAKDSGGATIGAISFDTASGTVTGVSSGGNGPY
jgi:hypothetical protein